MFKARIQNLFATRFFADFKYGDQSDSKQMGTISLISDHSQIQHLIAYVSPLSIFVLIS